MRDPHGTYGPQSRPYDFFLNERRKRPADFEQHSIAAGVVLRPRLEMAEEGVKDELFIGIARAWNDGRRQFIDAVRDDLRLNLRRNNNLFSFLEKALQKKPLGCGKIDAEGRRLFPVITPGIDIRPLDPLRFPVIAPAVVKLSRAQCPKAIASQIMHPVVGSSFGKDDLAAHVFAVEICLGFPPADIDDLVLRVRGTAHGRNRTRRAFVMGKEPREGLNQAKFP